MNDVCLNLIYEIHKRLCLNTKIDYIIESEIHIVIKDEKFICNKENDRKI